ncbi:MAG TPA: hypothetical protein VNH83_29185 [Bryobacteraceae bacterium]|nr:hypothetical protein [Bryobacteraceae bacterium]
MDIPFTQKDGALNAFLLNRSAGEKLSIPGHAAARFRSWTAGLEWSAREGKVVVTPGTLQGDYEGLKIRRRKVRERHDIELEVHT